MLSKITALLWFSIALASCKIQGQIAKSITGTYVNMQNEDDILRSQNTLKLKNDGTFYYSSYSWSHDIYTEGKWKASGNQISLNSFEVCEFLICDSEKSEIKEWPTDLYVTISDVKNNKLIGVQLQSIKSSTGIVSGIGGKSNLKNIDKNDTIQISYTGYNSLKLPTNQLLGNKFTVKLFEEGSVIPPSKTKVVFHDMRK